MTQGPEISSLRILPAIFFISFGAIAWQLALMRCLLIAKYHHFSFLVISSALLGFGVGGTILGLYRTWFERRFVFVFTWGALAFAVSVLFCFWLGEKLPLKVYFPPLALVSTLLWWFIFWVVHIIPFILAGVLIGLSLMTAGQRVNKIYAANLTGSAAGALGGIALMWYYAPNALVIPVSLSILVSAFFLIPIDRNQAKRAYTLCISGLILLLVLIHFLDSARIFPLSIDEYKTLAYIQKLEEQGNAVSKAHYNGPRGSVQLFASPYFHSVLALSSTQAPPPLDLILIDGFHAGSLPIVQNHLDTDFLKKTLSALPYKLVEPKRVLILGDAGGIYVWLARSSSTDEIFFVHPDENVIQALKMHESGLMNDSRIRIIIMEPRAFLDMTDLHFEIIHLVSLEGFSAGSGGIGGLREDYLATVEGFSKCFDRLAEGGLASIVRGIQDPERDNFKIAATWIEALEKKGLYPDNHLLIARDELSAVTLASSSALSLAVIEKFRRICSQMSWDMEWFPGISTLETNRIHVLPGPLGSAISWYQHGIRKMLSPARQQFYDTWICNVRPATDNKPFFYDFFRWESISKLREAFGPLWPSRAEMGFLLLVMASIWAFLTALVLLPGPVCQLSREQDPPAAIFITSVVLYFAALGAGFMFLEMSFIQIFTRFLGNPILAVALVVGCFLFFAGMGSITQPLIAKVLRGRIIAVVFIIAAFVVLDSLLFPRIFEAGAVLHMNLKLITSILMIAPLAFFLGMPFPWGLATLNKTFAKAIPLAWAVNGFASVVSTSAAVLIAMTLGFTNLLGLAILAYMAAGIVSFFLEKS